MDTSLHLVPVQHYDEPDDIYTSLCGLRCDKDSKNYYVRVVYYLHRLYDDEERPKEEHFCENCVNHESMPLLILANTDL